MTTPQNIEDIVKQFDDKFRYAYGTELNNKNAKAFIRTSLTRAIELERERIKERVEHSIKFCKGEDMNKIYPNARDELKSRWQAWDLAIDLLGVHILKALNNQE